jgi:hypothetical protein
LDLVVVQLEVEVAWVNVGAIDDHKLETVQLVEMAIEISNTDPVDAEGGATIHRPASVGHDRRAAPLGIYIREKWSDDHVTCRIKIEWGEFTQGRIERDVPVVIDE